MSKKTPMTSSEYKSRWRKKHPLTDKAIQKNIMKTTKNKHTVECYAFAYLKMNVSD